MNRRNQILVGLLTVQIIAGIIVFMPRAGTAVAPGQALFPGLAAGQVVAVTLTDGEGTSLRLAKSQGNWVLPDAGDYPAQAERVTVLLTKIAALKADQAVTQTAGSQKRLKVADNSFEGRVELEMADGSEHRLYLGSSPSYGVAHVRAGGQDQVYLVNGLSADDARPAAAGWVDPVYFSVPEDQIVALTLQNGGGKLEFVREADKWTMKGLAAGETLDDTAVQSLVRSAASVSLLEPLGKEDKAEYGLSAPSAVLTIQAHSDQAGDKTYTLRVGAKDAATNSYVLNSSVSLYFVRVNDYTVQDWVEKGRAGFLVVPPTPTP